MTMQYITTVYGSGGAGSFAITNIPQTFSHLQLRITARDYQTGTANAMYSYFNGVASGTLYSIHRMYGNRTSTGGDYATGQPYMVIPTVIPGTSAVANAHASIIIDLLDYTSTTKFKTIRLLGANDIGSSGVVTIFAGTYASYDPITSWTFTPGFSSGSRCDIYGINSNPIVVGAGS